MNLLPFSLRLLPTSNRGVMTLENRFVAHCLPIRKFRKTLKCALAISVIFKAVSIIFTTSEKEML